jgi:hypothetical protein
LGTADHNHQCGLQPLPDLAATVYPIAADSIPFEPAKPTYLEVINAFMAIDRRSRAGAAGRRKPKGSALRGRGGLVNSPAGELGTKTRFRILFAREAVRQDCVTNRQPAASYRRDAFDDVGRTCRLRESSSRLTAVRADEESTLQDRMPRRNCHSHCWASRVLPDSRARPCFGIRVHRAWKASPFLIARLSSRHDLAYRQSLRATAEMLLVHPLKRSSAERLARLRRGSRAGSARAPRRGERPAALFGNAT